MAELKIQIGCLASCIDVNQENTDAWRKETTACQKAMEVRLEKAKVDLEEMEAAVDVFEEWLNKMDTPSDR
jgi:hypothetical protein